MTSLKIKSTFLWEDHQVLERQDTDWKKILIINLSHSELVSRYRGNFHKSILRRQTAQFFKWAKNSKRYVTKESKWATKVEKMFTVITHREKINWSPIRQTYTHRLSKLKRLSYKVLARIWSKLNTQTLPVECKLAQPLWKVAWYNLLRLDFFLSTVRLL